MHVTLLSTLIFYSQLQILIKLIKNNHVKSVFWKFGIMSRYARNAEETKKAYTYNEHAIVRLYVYLHCNLTSNALHVQGSILFWVSIFVSEQNISKDTQEMLQSRNTVFRSHQKHSWGTMKQYTPLMKPSTTNKELQQYGITLINSAKPTKFLAHLSRRLIGELIIWQGCCLSVCVSCFYIFKRLLLSNH